MNAPRPPEHDKHVEAYEKMLARAKEAAGASREPSLWQRALAAAKDKAVALNELTHDEAEQIAAYVRRDVEDAARYLATTRKELRDWLRIDVMLVENKLLDLFSHAVDQTRVELDKLAMDAAVAEWHSGEITGIGALECLECGEHLHFHKSGHIPPCPKCKGSRFRRISEH